MTFVVFVICLGAGLLVPITFGLLPRTVLWLAVAALVAEVSGALLLAPTSATDCGRCSFGQDLLGFLVFAILPGLLLGLLVAALVRYMRRGQPASPPPA
jgi:hypothetical protein